MFLQMWGVSTTNILDCSPKSVSALGLSSNVYILFAPLRRVGMHFCSRHLLRYCGFRGDGRYRVGLVCESMLFSSEINTHDTCHGDEQGVDT